VIHKFREPGYGSEMSSNSDQPYCITMIDGPWELVFPAGFVLKSQAFVVGSMLGPFFLGIILGRKS
jgi:hypothetical protein